MRHVFFTALVAVGVGLVGCASQSSSEDRTSMSQDEALSKSNRVYVGTYHATNGAAYPTFTLSADGTYTWDTGVRCIKAPCPSGDSGRWSVFTWRGSKLVDLASNDPSIDDRWFSATPSPVTLTGVFGTTGTYTQGKVCGPDDWTTIVSPTIAQVEGTWSRHDQVGVVVTDETLHLHANGDYQLAKTIGPGCDASGNCAKFATHTEQSAGTFALNAGQGVQLVPSAPAADDVALSWILEQACGGGALRLSSTETNVDVHLAQAPQCQAAADCEPGDAPPNRYACMVGYAPTLTCDASTDRCAYVCAPTTN